ncbi:ABC transporter substrate-binding protein [Streptomyces rubiginosohelvolus]|uniref:ABC transporter substrate-binding protein n=1 Tax=Streptomyces rubiginosohelvolus TaxID=67362 RepID=UPI003F4CFF08
MPMTKGSMSTSMKFIRPGIVAGSFALLFASGCQLSPTESADEKPITIGTSSVLAGLDPAGVYDAGSWAVFTNIYQNLLTFEPGSPTPKPDAAESCEFTSPALTTYRCELRDGLTFSNGNPLTATAVKHSFERILRIRDPLGPGPLFANLLSVDARGSLVTFRLAAADATWPSKIATGAGSLVDPAEFPADRLREEESASGSGPYVIASYTAEKSITLKPNATYKGAVTRRGVAVEVHYFETSQNVEEAWNARTVDIAYAGLPAATLAGIDPSDEDVRLSAGDSAEAHYLVLNMRSQREPLGRAETRRALASLIDRGDLAGEVFEHTVTPLYSLVPQGVVGHSTAFFDRYPEADAAYAAERLRSAGVSTPVRIKLGHQNGIAAVEARALKEQWEKDGLFRVELVEERDFTTYQKRSLKGEFDVHLYQWIPDFPDADTFVQPLVGTGNVLGNGYTSAEVDHAIRDTQRFTDRSKAIQRFRAVQDTVAKDAPLIPVWHKQRHVVTRSTVLGGHLLAEDAVWRLWELRRL